MRTYDSSLFCPPAPLAIVSLRSVGQGAVVRDVPMLIDTGADIALIPESCVSELHTEVDPDEVYEVQGFDGTRSLANAVHLDLVFLARTFRGRFLIINSEHGILGRDVINHVAIVLDGPGPTWQERDPAQ